MSDNILRYLHKEGKFYENNSTVLEVKDRLAICSKISMQQKFIKKIQIKFREADPAGILFFGNILSLAHDTFEEFIQNVGFTWNDWFKTDEFIVPIRQTEAQFLSPFIPGQHYQIEAFVEKIGDSSLKMKYIFLKEHRIHAEVSMVHTFLNYQTKTKMRVPEKVRSKLEKFVHNA